MTDQMALESSKPFVMNRCQNIVRSVLTKFMMIQSPEEEYAKELAPYQQQAAERMSSNISTIRSQATVMLIETGES